MSHPSREGQVLQRGLLPGPRQPLVQGRPRHTQKPGGDGLVVVGPPHGLGQQILRDFLHRGKLIPGRKKGGVVFTGSLGLRRHMLQLHACLEEVHGQHAGSVVTDGIEYHGFEFSDIAGEVIRVEEVE